MDVPDSAPDSRLFYGIAGIAGLLVLAMVAGAALNPSVLASGQERTTVTLKANGETVGAVDALIADTRREMVTGLSDHESLADGNGMLFIHETQDERTYVMRDMAFPIDIVFVNSSCQITAIKSAAAPGPNESGEELKHQYSGVAKYVLEVPRGYAQERVSVGDTVSFEGGC